MNKSDSLAKLAPALVKAQKQMGAALKDAKNPFFKSKYADLNAIIDAAIPALNEQGIAVLQSPDVNEQGQSVINTVLLHESGEYISGKSLVVVSKPNDPQQHGSAMTYNRRYSLQSMVTLKAEDDDAESAMDRSKPTPKAVTPGNVQNTTAVSNAAFAALTTPPVTLTSNDVDSIALAAVKPEAKKSGGFKRPPTPTKVAPPAVTNGNEW